MDPLRMAVRGKKCDGIQGIVDELGKSKAKTLLGETLNEEKAADEKLTQLAKSRINREALLNAGAEKRKKWPRRQGAGAGRKR